MKKISVMDSSLIGVFATCTNDICLIPDGCREDIIDVISSQLKVMTYKCLIGDSTLIGSLCRGNENGFIVSNGNLNKNLEKKINKKVIGLPGKINAIGNIMLINDTACLVHPEISDRALNIIKNELNVDVRRGTIGNIKTVGMAGYVTNKGIIVNSKITDEEYNNIEDLFGMEPTICSVDLGSYMIGSSILANDNGCLVGVNTSGYEFGKIIKGLKLID